jgi:hypothetical protein
MLASGPNSRPFRLFQHPLYEDDANFPQPKVKEEQEESCNGRGEPAIKQSIFMEMKPKYSNFI